MVQLKLAFLEPLTWITVLGSVCDLMSFVFRIKAVERALDALKAMAGLDMLGLARRRRVRHKFDMLWEMLINEGTVL